MKNDIRNLLLSESSMRLNCPLNSLEILKNEFGKPYFISQNLEFSITHTYGVGAFILSSLPVGIDVEKFEVFDIWCLNIAKRFFSTHEYEFINNQKTYNMKKLLFCEIWTKKEAYAKYLGVGLSREILLVNVLARDMDSKFVCVYYDNYVLSVFGESKQKEIEFIYK